MLPCNFRIAAINDEDVKDCPTFSDLAIEKEVASKRYFLSSVMHQSSVEKRSAAILAASKMLALPTCN
jgi:hypothetical protein